jgi:hypothetical protein
MVPAAAGRLNERSVLNALIQGDAARHTKLWMRKVWRERMVPLVQMHDALGLSVSTREQAELVARLGGEAVDLLIPMKMDVKFGCDWADAKHSWEMEGKGAGAENLTPLSDVDIFSTAAQQEATPRSSPSSSTQGGGQTPPWVDEDGEDGAPLGVLELVPRLILHYGGRSLPPHRAQT